MPTSLPYHLKVGQDEGFITQGIIMMMIQSWSGSSTLELGMPKYTP